MALMSGRVCLVTGASGGIGLETARGLAELGASVILVARDRERGEAAREQVLAGAKGGAIDLLLADLASQKQVRALAAQVLERYRSLHVLVNNAATIVREYAETEDGIETQWAVNHLAPFLLTNLLLDLLRASAPSRVVNVASQVEASGSIDFEDAGRKERYDRVEAYCRSKLANVLFTYELARRLEGTGVTANCLHPGVIATRLLDDYLGRPRPLKFLTRLRNPGAREGARTSIYLASSPEVEKVSGKYFDRSRPVPSSARSREAELARRLWELSERRVGLEVG